MKFYHKTIIISILEFIRNIKALENEMHPKISNAFNFYAFLFPTYSLGNTPTFCLKNLLKWLKSENPELNATSLTYNGKHLKI
jgi:hypothetical protein